MRKAILINCKQCQKAIIDTDDDAFVCISCGGQNRRIKQPNKFHWLLYRIFYYFWNPILRGNPLLLEKFELSITEHKEVDK